MPEGVDGSVVVENPAGRGPYVLVCDHASTRLPDGYGSLGLPPAALRSHIAWDPGALDVAQQLSRALDAPLLWPDVSRLIIDCNRDLAAPDLIVTEGDGEPIPGNATLTSAERSRRVATVHAPYHRAVEACVEQRQAAGMPTALIAIHSFTPTWQGALRPWQIGIVFDDDRRLADPVIGMLQSDRTLSVGINQPYSPADRVYYTLARHGSSQGIAAVMIEIRNDEIADEAGQVAWAHRLADIFDTLRPTVIGKGDAAA